MKDFFPGMDDIAQVKHMDRVFISVNRLRSRKSDFTVREWIMDSGAFTELSTYGRYREGVEAYAAHINRWKRCGTLRAAVAQDYMCEPWIVEKTGLSVSEHQRLTIERYDALRPLTDVYVLPVLQGYEPSDYVKHLKMYGDRIGRGVWVGVGSICKRNSNPEAIFSVLAAIKSYRPSLLLHGFGLKETALRDGCIRDLLHTADSMAWSFHARKVVHAERMAAKERGDDMSTFKPSISAHDYRETLRFVNRINAQKLTPQRKLMLA